MSRSIPSQRIREFALQLVSYEASRRDLSGVYTAPGFLAFEKLRLPLIKLAGGASFLSLVGRALTLAKARMPVLSVVHIRPDGSLDGLDELGSEEQDASEMLIAELLRLLVVFVGESLTRSLLHGVWPDLSITDKKMLEKKPT